MEVSTIFYITGIIYFIAWIVLLVFLGVLGWKAYQYVLGLPQEIRDTVEAKVKSILPTSKTGLMGVIGTFVTPIILSKVRGMFKKKL